MVAKLMVGWVGSDVMGIGVLSGSFWYPNFIEWLESNAKAKPGRAYISIGDKEGASKKPAVFAKIKEQTREVVSCLERHGIQVIYEVTPGNHYSPIGPRLDSLLKVIAGR